MSDSRDHVWRIATDTGGTFTDCHALRPDGSEHRVKVLSSGCLRASVFSVEGSRSLVLGERWHAPEDFFAGYELRLLRREGVIASSIVASSETERGTRLRIQDHLADLKTGELVELSAREAAPVLGARLLTGTSLSDEFPPLKFRLATTRATNALLERKGSRVAFFVTRGFGDLLLIGDQRRGDLFALKHEPRAIYYDAVCEVVERLDAQGAVITALDEAALRENASALVRQGITTAAVALLHSDINPAHEIRVREILHEAGFTNVSLGSELAPFIRILPRAQSAIANAYLTGPVENFINDVRRPLRKASSLHLMTSAGSLETAEFIKPKDLLLSGPAAGVLGALNAARRLGHERIITFDMGGTSTDVARIDAALPYRFTQTVGSLTLMSPAVAIETVAAGGGSICSWTPSGLAVGPQSAGADPGPACYGKGGPLTVTDVNLLLGRFDASRAPIPLDPAAAEARLAELLQTVNAATNRAMSRDELLHSLLALAVECMADAIRKISVLEGYQPFDYALLAFGGAGPQHACDVAGHLGIRTIIAPFNAGILSAVGLQEAVQERFAAKQILQDLNAVAHDLPEILSGLEDDAVGQLVAASTSRESRPCVRKIAELRLRGQDTPLQIEFDDASTLAAAFAEKFAQLFGYSPSREKPVELVTLRVIASEHAPHGKATPGDAAHVREKIEGPALVQDAFSTLIIHEGWSAGNHEGVGWILRRSSVSQSQQPQSTTSADILRHRFTGIVDDMGALLRRTALSTNIRERLDFSCALLSPEGQLISSAPHIPVHLGALGVCVREVIRHLPLDDGDTVITNHPAFGGSHLPDVTLITPAFMDGRLLGYVANRAHHAEIGGRSPGSMPADATTLIEEGVVIPPMLLCHAHEADFARVRELLLRAPFPTRSIEDNIADLHAQLAANRLGVERLRALGMAALDAMKLILDESRIAMQRFMETLPLGEATELLDDGAMIHVRITRDGSRLRIDFAGTSSQHRGNLNATPAIVRSAVLYVLRLALQQNLPLNEGLLRDVDVILPEGSFLNPQFDDDAAKCPAVVGGNVEISQRVVDTLIKALRLQACSQGTMNNFLFGNERFGYYETICGGAGAGDGYDGASALHTHMTNTAITDAEVIERRYPVRVREFSVRRGSGGAGHWRGGDGIVREFEFLEPLTVSLLTQHRKTAPFGMNGGGDGQHGRQIMIGADGEPQELQPSTTFDVTRDQRVRIETPGGGGFGRP